MWVEIEIPEVLLDSVLDSGLHHGVAYWARLTDGPTPALAHVEDVEEGGGKIHDLTIPKVQDALAHMSRVAPEQFGMLLSGNADMHTGDVLIQLALFGEVRYG